MWNKWKTRAGFYFFLLRFFHFQSDVCISEEAHGSIWGDITNHKQIEIEIKRRDVCVVLVSLVGPRDLVIRESRLEYVDGGLVIRFAVALKTKAIDLRELTENTADEQRSRARTKFCVTKPAYSSIHFKI